MNKEFTYFELPDAFQEVQRVVGDQDLSQVKKWFDLFDPKQYIAVKLHSLKEWRKYVKLYGNNIIMASPYGLFAALRNRELKLGTIIAPTKVFAKGIGLHIIERNAINEINTYTTVRKFIEADIPIYIEGFSGWGKSSIVKQIAKDINMPIITLSLASISPEDFGGIPRVQDEAYFKYILPEWALRYKEPFILFLDEINQAPISVLHACYGLVLDRVLNGTKLPCKIVAAGNFLSENEYLTDISTIKPLMERFYKYTLNHDKAEALAFLEDKYDLQLGGLLAADWEQTSLNPRRIEKYINMIKAGITAKELVTNPEDPCESAYYILEKIIKGSYLSETDMDAKSKVDMSMAGMNVSISEGAEEAIYSQLMEQVAV